MPNYPNSQPNIASAGANLSTNPHSALHDGMRDEIAAIAAELGLSPSGSATTVRARLDDGLLGRSQFSRAAAFTETTNVAMPVVFTAEDRDDDGWGAAGGSTFTCPATGIYAVGVAATFSGHGYLILSVSSNENKQIGIANSNAVGDVLMLRAGDTLVVQLRGTSGPGVPTVSGTGTNWSLLIQRLA